MSSLSKKLSSVLLCGSMAVTLLGNSGVHAADEIPEAIENKSDGEVTAVGKHDDKVENDDEKNEDAEVDTNEGYQANEIPEAIEDKSEEKVTAVDEHGNKVENDDEKNEDAEVDTNNKYQNVEEEDIPAQNLAKRAGSSFAANVAKGLGTVALGTGIGIGANEGVRRRFKRDSSGNEAGGQAQAPIVSKDGTKIKVLESQVIELQKKLEEAEKNPTVSGNLLWGASAGFWGFIPALRDKVGDALGRDIDSKSKESIIAAVIAETIGLFFAVWNIFKMFGIAGAKPVSWKQWTNSVSKTVTDVLLPPVGLVWEFANLVINEFKGDESERIGKISSFKNSDPRTQSIKNSQFSDDD